jgi:hypothetical protein
MRFVVLFEAHVMFAMFHLFQVLDSPPVLRRLTVNGDMNDYISRQAALTLKENGVYAVESTEDKGSFAWKFEYLVEDRRIPESGKVMDGEKVNKNGANFSIPF